MLTWLTSEIGARPLGLTRIIVGGAALFRSFVTWQVLHRLAEPDIVRVPYADWIPDPSVPLAVTIVVVWTVAAVLFTLGWKVPLTGSLLLASIVVTLSVDQQTYGNHLYLMALLVLLLTLADAGAGMNIRRVDRPVVRWPVLLIMIQASLVYGFSSVTKLNENFLSGAVLAGTLGRGLIPFPEALRTTSVLSAVAAAAVFVELFVAIFIWRTRFRPTAFVLGLLLHTAITLSMSGTLELLAFSLEMLAIYPLFLSQEKLVAFWDDECESCSGWIARFRRLDLLRSLDLIGKSDRQSPYPAHEVENSMRLVHHGENASGFRAVTLILEHLVPTLWVAPALRLPGLGHIGESWYRWQARRRSCPIGGAMESETTADSKAR